MTAYSNRPIIRDEIGNPTDDFIWHYTWEYGRQLAFMWKHDHTQSWQYSYNADGLRTQRKNTAANRTYNYTYLGSQLTHMTVDGHTMYFAYDASGTPLTLTYDSEIYYYVTNLQGDVVAILNASGTEVDTYSYDAWGNIITPDAPEDTVGFYNPLRYRGYVYDTETGLYYLQSRYYNPEMGRFINADGLASTGQGFIGNNMFAYCLNNLVMFVDSTGSNSRIAVLSGEVSAVFAVLAMLAPSLPAVPIIVTIIVAADVNIQETIAKRRANTTIAVAEFVFDWLDEQKKRLEDQIATSLSKAVIPEPEKYHVHHIVAQKSAQASLARYILVDCLNISVHNIMNLVLVRETVYHRLHNTWYYNTVNVMVYTAYTSAGMDRRKQYENVTNVLLTLRVYIDSLNAL